MTVDFNFSALWYAKANLRNKHGRNPMQKQSLKLSTSPNKAIGRENSFTGLMGMPFEYNPLLVEKHCGSLQERLQVHNHWIA